ncbi:MAG: hypothetical protein NTX87_09860, partial [Planctomycetota bacterium]|nr:hypothetical protein [Planctomycetota bacterium]
MHAILRRSKQGLGQPASTFMAAATPAPKSTLRPNRARAISRAPTAAFCCSSYSFFFKILLLELSQTPNISNVSR